MLEWLAVNRNHSTRISSRGREGGLAPAAGFESSTARNNLTQLFNKQVNLFFPQNQRRQQPQNLRVARRSRNDLLCEQRFMNFLRAVHEFKSEQKTTTVHIHDLLDFFQTCAQ